jgi:hypothetical protein
MAAKGKTAKYGFKAAKAAPAKGKLAKGGLKLGRRKAERTPAGTAVLYGRALVGNQEARDDLREAYASARKAYARSSDRRGRPDIGALIDDRKARRDAGKAASSLQEALRIAGRKRKKPKSSKAPVIAVIAVAGAGTAVALNEDLRGKVLAPFSGSDGGDGDPSAHADGGPVAAPAA